ncbi:hypothetical protein D3C84_863540 [compost metagenome]
MDKILRTNDTARTNQTKDQHANIPLLLADSAPLRRSQNAGDADQRQDEAGSCCRILHAALHIGNVQGQQRLYHTNRQLEQQQQEEQIKQLLVMQRFTVIAEYRLLPRCFACTGHCPFARRSRLALMHEEVHRCRRQQQEHACHDERLPLAERMRQHTAKQRPHNAAGHRSGLHRTKA